MQVIDVNDDELISQLFPSTVTVISEALFENPVPFMLSCWPLGAPLLGLTPEIEGKTAK